MAARPSSVRAKRKEVHWVPQSRSFIFFPNKLHFVHFGQAFAVCYVDVYLLCEYVVMSCVRGSSELAVGCLCCLLQLACCLLEAFAIS